MPGPFPGMDPYLEHPAGWPNFHHLFITFASVALNQVLPGHYVARISERVYVIPPERNLYPDVIVLERPAPRPAPAPRAGGTAVALATEPTGILTVLPEERHEGFIQIMRPDQEDAVITVLELLSPSNKAPGSDGRELYRTKPQELLRSPTSLIEIDLLRSGEHTVAPPRERLLSLGQWDYLVVSRRGGPMGRYEVWLIALPEPLPRIRVPLAGEDPDVVLDLQAVLDRCYEEGAYARQVNYRREPVPPLEGDTLEWAHALLRERGLRPGDSGASASHL
jgi:Protein of unknown function (DUF4058)